jgi:hypothetical protein
MRSSPAARGTAFICDPGCTPAVGADPLPHSGPYSLPRPILNRFLPIVLAALVAGCTIDQTPSRYIDHQQTPEEEISRSRDELMSRIRSTAPALRSRRLEDVLTAMNPDPGIVLIMPDSQVILSGPEEFGEGLERMNITRSVTIGDLEVIVGPRNASAWFHGDYRVASGGEAERMIRLYGVFLRRGGEWWLVQLHLSEPVSSPDLPPAEADPVPGPG